MNALMIVLRLLHIVGGAFWVGTAIFNRFFLMPGVASTGEAGQSLMRYLMIEARLTARLTIAAYVAVLSGAVLYWIDSQGFTSAWQSSGPGVGFGLGALAAVVGLGFGQLVGKYAALVARLAGQAKDSPTPEDAAGLQQARAKMNSASLISTVALIIALGLMATARYWLF